MVRAKKLSNALYRRLSSIEVKRGFYGVMKPSKGFSNVDNKENEIVMFIHSFTFV